MKNIILIPSLEPDGNLVILVDGLIKTGFKHIIVVDDGSQKNHSKDIFHSIATKKEVTVLKHAVNLGKGAALKFGLNHIYNSYDDFCVVTVDSDGQHLVDDIQNIAESCKQNIENLILGTRGFRKGVPFRSKFGNILTKYVFKLLTGLTIEDTQTGLRGIPKNFIPKLLPITSNGYEFELDMLLKTREAHISIDQVSIKTVYLNDNKDSHFSPIWDSMRIYFVFLRFVSASVISAIIDYLIFSLSYIYTSNVLGSLAIARIISGYTNFNMNKKHVFALKQNGKGHLAKYVILAITLVFLSNIIITALVDQLKFNVYISKIFVECFLFIASFTVQRDLIFVKRKNLLQNFI